jgi:hypothetical protein
MEKYLKCISELNRIENQYKLNQTEVTLLNMIANEIMANNSYYIDINKLITLNVIKPSTLNRTIDLLHKKKLITIKKYATKLNKISLSNLAYTRYEELGRAIDKAAKRN